MLIDGEQDDIKPILKSNGHSNEADSGLYLPSHTGFGFKEFMEHFGNPLLPFDSIEIVDSEDITECFTGAYSLNVNKSILLLLLIIFYLC